MASGRVSAGAAARGGSGGEFGQTGEATSGNRPPILAGDRSPLDPASDGVDADADPDGLPNGLNSSAADNVAVRNHASIMLDASRMDKCHLHHEGHYAFLMDTPGERLKLARERAGYDTAKAAAEAMGAAVATYIQHENGSRGFPAARAERYAKFFRVAPEWLLYKRGDPDDGVTTDSVPVVGLVGAGSVATLFAEGQGPLDYVEPPQNATPHTVALQVRGTSLGPAWDESIIFYDDVRSPVTPDLHGRLCVVGLPDGRVLVKILKAAGDGTFHLLSNSLEEPLLNEEVAWAARVKAAHPR